MTNEERKEMYQDWENLLGTHLYSVDHDERVGMLESLLKGIGRRLDYDMTSLLLLINEYDKEACKPDVEPKVGDLAILKGDVWNTNFKAGSVVQVLGVRDDKQMVLVELINLDRVLYTTSVRAEILDIIGTSIRQEEV